MYYKSRHETTRHVFTEQTYGRKYNGADPIQYRTSRTSSRRWEISNSYLEYTCVIEFDETKADRLRIVYPPHQDCPPKWVVSLVLFTSNASVCNHNKQVGAPGEYCGICQSSKGVSFAPHVFPTRRSVMNTRPGMMCTTKSFNAY